MPNRPRTPRTVPHGPRAARETGGKMKVLRGLAATLLLAATGCTFVGGDPTVYVTSTPAGASIEIDGRDTGQTTPARFDFSTWYNLAGAVAGDHSVTIRKNGYEPETRVLYHHTTLYTSRWIDGATSSIMFSNPLFWTVGDFFTPFAARWAYVPHNLHVRLYPEGEAPGWDPGAEDPGRSAPGRSAGGRSAGGPKHP